jgi:hypothetical protein
MTYDKIKILYLKHPAFDQISCNKYNIRKQYKLRTNKQIEASTSCVGTSNNKFGRKQNKHGNYYFLMSRINILATLEKKKYINNISASVWLLQRLHVATYHKNHYGPYVSKKIHSVKGSNKPITGEMSHTSPQTTCLHLAYLMPHKCAPT